MEVALKYASLFPPIAILVSAAIAASALFVARQNQRHSNARSTWLMFVKIALDQPVFAYPPKFADQYDLDKQEVGGCKKEFERYEWFLSLLFCVADEVLALEKRGSPWFARIERNIGFHIAYISWRVRNHIREPNFITTAGPKVRSIVEDALRKTR